MESQFTQKRIRFYNLISEVLDSSGLKYEYHDQFGAFTFTLNDGREEYLVIASFSDEGRWAHINAIFPHKADVADTTKICVAINDLNRRHHTTAPLQFNTENGEIISHIHLFAPDGTTKSTMAVCINACLETLAECRNELLEAIGTK